MKIKLYTKDGYTVLVCEDQVFTEPLDRVIFNSETSMMSLRFKISKHEVELDCPVDVEAAEHIRKNNFCGIGFMKDGEIQGAAFIPLETTQNTGEA